MTVLRSCRLLVFAACSFLYELADAPLLTLVGQKLGSDQPGAGIMLTSALIMASQAGMLAASILVGKRADRLGYRWLMALGFAMLPAQGVLTALSESPTYLIAVQVFGGVGTGLFAALSASRRPASSDTTVTSGHGRHETRTADVFSATRAVAGTEWQFLIETIVRVTRHVLHRDAKTGLWSSTAEIATTWPMTLRRHATPPPQSDVTGMSRTLCTTPATSPSRKISLASVISQASLPGCARLPTTYCAAISPQHSVRIDMPPLSPEPMRSSTGNSIESVEQPWRYPPPGTG